MDNLDSVLFVEMDTEALKEAHNANYDYLDIIMGDDIEKLQKERRNVEDDDE